MKIKDSTTRKYLFHGKRKDTGEWVEGDLYHNKDSGVYITNYDADGNYYEVEVIPESVGMFTTLTDKNGTRIFENDIVKFKHDGKWYNGQKKEDYIRNYKIEFFKSFCFCGYRFINGRTHFTCKQSTLAMHDSEVIGNAYDNPELLEGGGENAK